jgi:hypothetical protein
MIFQTLTASEAFYLEDCMESAGHHRGYFGSCHCIEFWSIQFPVELLTQLYSRKKPDWNSQLNKWIHGVHVVGQRPREAQARQFTKQNQAEEHIRGSSILILKECTMEYKLSSHCGDCGSRASVALPWLAAGVAAVYLPTAQLPRWIHAGKQRVEDSNCIAEMKWIAGSIISNDFFFLRIS